MSAAEKLPEPIEIDETFEPQNDEELKLALKSWRWRIFSGKLYKIMTKDDEDQEGAVIPFQPNAAQIGFLEDLYHRNIILKARQLGFTTLIAVLWLDHALFVAHQRVGIIAHSLDDAEVIFRDKVVFAYDNLPDLVKALCPVKHRTQSSLLFAHNNSAIRVATSMRSGTIHRLHVSEMGKIAAKFPHKAVEIVTGTLPAVPVEGVAVIESTAEGQSGEFFEMATKAENRNQLPRPLSKREWKFHFFPWYIDPNYVADPTHVIITATEHEYFDSVERRMGVKLYPAQRAWYIFKRDSDMSGDSEKMWREFPSTPEECWQKSTEGTFYTPQLARARQEGRITKVPHVSNVPVHTFWDIGAGDGTAIWSMQHVGAQHRFLRFDEGWAEGYSHYINILRQTGWVFGIHYLPHDAQHERQMKDGVKAPIDMLRELAPDWRFEIVPRVHDLQFGIDQTRGKFGEAWFDEEGCKSGLEHIALYHKKWNNTLGVFTNEPEKLDGHSEAADALRQWAQGYDPTLISFPSRPSKRKRPKGGMSV